MFVYIKPRGLLAIPTQQNDRSSIKKQEGREMFLADSSSRWSSEVGKVSTPALMSHFFLLRVANRLLSYLLSFQSAGGEGLDAMLTAPVGK